LHFEVGHTATQGGRSSKQANKQTSKRHALEPCKSCAKSLPKATLLAEKNLRYKYQV